jgi:hypothetical protein
MEKIYDQVFDNLLKLINKPELINKINQQLLDPLKEKFYKKTQYYFITIISLYGLTIILLLIIISILITKK